MKPWEHPYYYEDDPEQTVGCDCYGCATMRHACQYENKKKDNQNGQRATNTLRSRGTKKADTTARSKSQERYLADAKKGANQEYYYAERELKDFNRKLRERGVKV